MFFVGGCSAINFNIEYEQGMKAYKAKNYEDAIVYFSNALNYKPDSYSAMCLLGTSYAYSKDEKMAEKIFQDAIDTFPDNWNAYVFLGDLKRSQKDYDSSIELFETAVTLESMGGKEKTYYKNLIKEIKIEQSNHDLKQQNFLNDKSKLTEISNTDEQNIITTKKQTGDVVLNLDKAKWEKVFSETSETIKSITYGLKGEDVKNFKWTQLITIQYFIFSEQYKTTLNEYFNHHISSIEKIAKDSNKNFEKKIIQQGQNNILYEWSFDGAQEVEIAKIYYTPQGIYHIHIAKKSPFTNDEKSQYVNLIKNAIYE
jgi:tetratricopeptide (TPR) repeat protein